jgi:hypothetical protein
MPHWLKKKMQTGDVGYAKLTVARSSCIPLIIKEASTDIF